MSKFNYSGLASTATNLVSRFGKTLKKRTVTNSGSDWNPTQTTTDTDIDGVIVTYGLNEIDGTLILSTDKKLLTTSSIDMDDKIVDGTTVYNIIAINKLEPSTVTLLYSVQLRGNV